MINLKSLLNKPLLAKISGDYFQDISKLKDMIQSCESFYKAIIICGGGNFMRGKTVAGMQRNYADAIGILSTEINGITLLSILNELYIEAKLFSGDARGQYAYKYSIEECLNAINNGAVPILTSGLNCGYLSTDTALVIRALELDCIPVKVTVVGGVFNNDPKKDPDAVMYKELSYGEAFKKDLIDKNAIAIAEENKLPFIVTDFAGYNNMLSENFDRVQCTTINA